MDNAYLPKIAKIVDVQQELTDVRTFSLRFASDQDQDDFHYKPGQFIELSMLGLGEAPISISSSPSRKSSFDITVKAIGSVTQALHAQKPGSLVGVRGPYGNGFPVDEVAGMDILFVGGGIGLAPLRSLLVNLLDNRSSYGRITLLYGARTPSELLFKQDLAAWAMTEGMEVHTTVDVADESWTGNVGVVTTLFAKISPDPKQTIAFVCGPPVMFRFVIAELLKLGFSDDRIISTLERYMKCGIGKCGHCCIGHKYVCVDGPVFNYREIKTLQEEI
jgi:NAD(P)H-flavin reductase